MNIKAIFQQLMTGKDGQTHDLGRWSWVVSTASVIGAGAWNALHAGAVDVMQLAQAIGVVVAAHGGALWAKRATEPEAPHE
jgi:uncharacterized membrane protein